MHSKLIIANWKMYLSHNEEVMWLTKHATELDEILKNTIHSLVICPSFESLKQAASLSQDHHLSIGAQDCSPHEKGAYTGQVAAISLHQIGCTHCIVGHSETRSLLCQSNETIGNKLKQAIAHKLIPVVAIGESENDYTRNLRKQRLAEQLDPVFAIIRAEKLQSIHIAYEPIWAIGTGKVAQKSDLESAFEDISQLFNTAQLEVTIKLLYGGSVKSTNTAELLTIDKLDGFLIGSASTDFQELKKIVSLIASAD